MRVARADTSHSYFSDAINLGDGSYNGGATLRGIVVVLAGVSAVVLVVLIIFLTRRMLRDKI